MKNELVDTSTGEIISHKKIVNMLNYDYTQQQYETTILPSKTIPDHTMSLRDILDRYTRGLPVDAKIPRYELDENGEGDEFAFLGDMKKYDLAELQQMREDAREQVEHIKKQLNEKAAEVKKQKEQLEKDRQQVARSAGTDTVKTNDDKKTSFKTDTDPLPGSD